MLTGRDAWSKQQMRCIFLLNRAGTKGFGGEKRNARLCLELRADGCTILGVKEKEGCRVTQGRQSARIWSVFMGKKNRRESGP